MPKSRKSIQKKSKSKFEVGSGNIFVDLGFPEDEAINMLVRAELMGEIRRIIREMGWTQTEAAKVLKVGQPRVAEIMSMKTQHYSIDLLMKLLSKLGKKVSVTIEDSHQAA
jgi:predicted XRE-type DNA-binding protein